jgi:hypothetical protein
LARRPRGLCVALEASYSFNGRQVVGDADKLNILHLALDILPPGTPVGPRAWEAEIKDSLGIGNMVRLKPASGHGGYHVPHGLHGGTRVPVHAPARRGLSTQARLAFLVLLSQNKSNTKCEGSLADGTAWHIHNSMGEPQSQHHPSVHEPVRRATLRHRLPAQ